jgi:hypothetical protein
LSCDVHKRSCEDSLQSQGRLVVRQLEICVADEFQYGRLPIQFDFEKENRYIDVGTERVERITLLV